MVSVIHSEPKITCVGGGTGTFVVLSGLKKYCRPSAVVSMADSGGSTGRLRDEFGILPPGDVRQALVALSSEDKAPTLRRLFSYRFSRLGSLYGHNFGNLFLTALSDILGGEDRAIEEAGRILGVRGHVFPVTLDNIQLMAEYKDGEQVLGEGAIDDRKDSSNGGIKNLSLVPRARLFVGAKKALLDSDLIVIGPGDVFTSLLPNLLVEGVCGALSRTPARLVYVVNLVTKRGQTDGFSARDHLELVEKYLGREFDFVLVNRAPIPDEVWEHYESKGEFPVEDDLTGSRIVRGDFLSARIHRNLESDKARRSLIRHDPDKLARALLTLLAG